MPQTSNTMLSICFSDILILNLNLFILMKLFRMQCEQKQGNGKFMNCLVHTHKFACIYKRFRQLHSILPHSLEMNILEYIYKCNWFNGRLELCDLFLFVVTEKCCHVHELAFVSNSNKDFLFSLLEKQMIFFRFEISVILI